MADAGAVMERRAMLTFTHTISDPHGLHARNAFYFSQAVQRYGCRVCVNCLGRSADGRRPFELMNLKAAKGAELVVQIEGEQEAEAARELKALACRML